ncbi:MAG TPA: 50S ribosomal protein L25/general stress protein Ctc [Candidatus Methylomirabilis sp.]|nr:50S ribosomal protein L25/general stress protein Ctc [Candidatus Methylomirabilis sp.]
MAMMELTAERRRDTGKEINRKRRAEGRIPGVIYGKGLETRSIEFQRKPLEKFVATARRGTVIVKMTVQDGADGKESYAVLKEVQTHPLTDRITHVDFYEVALGKKFRVEIPLRVKGKAPGIEMGGVLDVVTRSLEVECTPDHVPEFLELDVSSLEIGQSIHLADIRFPEGVVPTEKDLRITLAAVNTPKAEAAPAAAEEVAVEGAEGASVAEAAGKEGKEGKEEKAEKEPRKKE